MGFFWLYQMWGGFLGKAIFDKLSSISVWSDIEDIIQEAPWFIGFFVWWFPRLLFTIVGISGVIVFFNGLYFYGLLTAIICKILGTGWTFHFYDIMHDVMEYHVKKWYLNLHKWTMLNSEKSIAISKKTNFYKRYYLEKQKILNKINKVYSQKYSKYKSWRDENFD